MSLLSQLRSTVPSSKHTHGILNPRWFPNKIQSLRSSSRTNQSILEARSCSPRGHIIILYTYWRDSVGHSNIVGHALRTGERKQCIGYNANLYRNRPITSSDRTTDEFRKPQSQFSRRVASIVISRQEPKTKFINK